MYMCMQVEALRSKVSSLEADLRSSATVSGKLQKQLVQERKEGRKNIEEIRHKKEDYASQVSVDVVLCVDMKYCDMWLSSD